MADYSWVSCIAHSGNNLNHTLKLVLVIDGKVLEKSAQKDDFDKRWAKKS